MVETVTCRDTKQIRINITRARIDLALEAGDRRKFVQLAMLLRDLKRQSQDQTTAEPAGRTHTNQ
ncbi:hypothetical protein [Amycolatopsis palatopharyngis]|uniref:hypothetical protein n=1 Tax=Amycolatopsis palatopharyngis TaxID=187982 RepID=UPI0013BEAB02|nr:hypothetical protein [Amycolatopsis palatopharyngis]